MVHRKPFTSPSPSCHHLVSDQEHAVLVADPTKLRHVLIRRDDDAVRPNNRLNQNRSHIRFVADHVLDIVSTRNAAIWIGMPYRALVAVDLRPKQNPLALPTWLHRPASRIA